MLKQGVLHTFDFGPELLINGKVPSFKNQDWFTTVRAPRTAIGQRKPYEYIIITVDGRSSESSGMTFAELVKVFQSKGVKWAYNLDGGGSTTLYYLDNILNHPSDGEERPISDILYFTE
jgi:exopolysaccharide biosynthesis protein